MDVNGREVLVCDCEGTMPIDGARLGRACGAGGPVAVATRLCGAQIGRLAAALEGNRPLLVACTQQAAVFRAAAAEAGHPEADMALVNVREAAGWSREAEGAAPKMAGLIAAAALGAGPTTPRVTLNSAGVTLIYGRDEAAIEAAERLKDRLDVTVMLTGSAEVAPPATAAIDYPIVRGTIVKASGHLGAFELTVDGFAEAAPSSREALRFGTVGRDGAVSRCDLILDLSGGAPLFPAHDKRDGYLRPDPGDRLAVAEAAHAAADLTGEFDKPRYVAYDAAICVHSRSRKTGCRNCLDACPTGAIASAGDKGVVIDPYVCAGCGTCAAVCPTGAASYAPLPAATLAERLRALVLGYLDAGGREPLVLLHDLRHGEPLIHALARFGDGLPARVLPLAVEEVTRVGLDALAAAFAHGAAELRVLAPARTRADLTPLRAQLDLAETILSGLGHAPGRVGIIEADDPDRLAEALAPTGAPPATAPRRPARFLPMGDKRDVMRAALEALNDTAPTPLAPGTPLALPPGAPFGRLDVDAANCTLCLACVSACPTGAIGDDPDRPMLTFVEDACVQCGLCAATCPERVIALEPRLTFGPERRARAVIKTEEPAECVRCGKAFGTKASVERVIAKLAGRHWMFPDPTMIERIRMCADCRVVVQVRSGLDPHAGPARPRPRTAADYPRPAPSPADDG